VTVQFPEIDDVQLLIAVTMPDATVVVVLLLEPDEPDMICAPSTVIPVTTALLALVTEIEAVLGAGIRGTLYPEPLFAWQFVSVLSLHQRSGAGYW
jgi:hypothetical protein